MLVGKPTGIAGKAKHSTYEFAISGEVVGVPDKKIDSWNIMPESIKEKYKSVVGGKEAKTKPIQSKVIAAEMGVVRELEPQVKSKAQLIGENANLSARVKFLLELAKDMDSMKMSPKKIFATTGWEKGKEGKWRYEIPDGKFKDIDIDDLKQEIDVDGKVVRVSKLGDIFNAPDLYAAYPDARSIKVQFKKLPENNYGGYSNRSKKISINIDLYNKSKAEAELTLLHEIQHYIQYTELFETGSNVDIAKKLMVSILDGLKKNIKDLKTNPYFKKSFPEKYNKDLKRFTDAYERVLNLSRETPNKLQKEQQEERGYGKEQEKSQFAPRVDSRRRASRQD
jgi:hypothetical protein